MLSEYVKTLITNIPSRVGGQVVTLTIPEYEALRAALTDADNDATQARQDASRARREEVERVDVIRNYVHKLGACKEQLKSVETTLERVTSERDKARADMDSYARSLDIVGREKQQLTRLRDIAQSNLNAANDVIAAFTAEQFKQDVFNQLRDERDKLKARLEQIHDLTHRVS